jgi:DNA polymerase-1
LVTVRDHVADAINELLSHRVPLAADIETSGTSAAFSRQLKVVTVGTPDLVVALDPRDEYQRPVIRRVLGEAPELIFHNGAFDVPLLVGDGLADIEIVERTTCTLIAARLAIPGREKRTLSALASRFLGVETGDIVDIFKAAGYKNRSQGFESMDIDAPTYLTSAMLDTAVTARLRPALDDAVVTQLTQGHGYTSFGLDREGALAELHRQQVVNRGMLRASVRGYTLDENYYTKYIDSQVKVQRDAEMALEAAGLNPGHGPSLAAKLSADGLLPAGWKRTTKTHQPSAERDELKKLKEHPLVAAHLTYTEIRKNRDDYLDKLLDYARFDGRVHPQLHILGAGATGRMSAGDPPVQQFPDTARQMVLADDPDGWVSIDWTAVEPMVAAYTSGQLDLSRAVVGGADTYVPVARAAGLIPPDVPDADAKEHPGRKAAKVVVLGLLYGKGVELLATELGTDYESARGIKDSVLSSVPLISQWMTHLRDAAEVYATTITSAGRIVPVERKYPGGPVKGYMAQNYYHQGSAYDCLADALVEIHRQGLAPHIRMAIHDELVVTAEAADDVRRIMQNATPSLSRFLTKLGRVEYLHELTLPTDAKALPERWMKV